MRSRFGAEIRVVSGALLIAALGWTAYAQKPHSSQPAEKAEIFCEAKSAGQLCTHGTLAVLKLSDEKQQKWIEASQRYNAAIETATKQFLTEAKAILPADDFAKVEKWFDKSVNAQINRQLLATRD